jgi:predicted transcriptional regulator of viral defense system
MIYDKINCISSIRLNFGSKSYKMVKEQTGYAITQGTRLLQALLAEGRYIFDMGEAKEVAAQLDMRPERLKWLLFELVQGGWLSRLKRGLYVGTGKLPGEAHVHSFAIATRLVTPAAISHWSAMSHHGLTEQLPQHVMAITPQKIYPPSLRQKEGKRDKEKHAWEIDGVRYEYMTITPEHFFGIEQVWVDQMFRVPITDKERTLLEGFASPQTFGSLSEILGILEEHLKELDVPKLIQYALQYNRIAVVKRLGWALEQMSIPHKKLQPLKDYPASGYRLLDPTKPKQGSHDSRWMIQNNLKANS